MLQVDELELDKCYEITVTVTAVNEMGESIPEVFNITCDGVFNSIIGKYLLSTQFLYIVAFKVIHYKQYLYFISRAVMSLHITHQRNFCCQQSTLFVYP